MIPIRLLTSIPTLFIICFVSFALMTLAPGDPTQVHQDPTVSTKDLDQLRINLGLDDPMMVQFGRWLGRTASGDLGHSLISGEPVSSIILSRLGPTLLLSVSSLMLIFFITFLLGLYSGAKAYGWGDRLIMIGSVIGLSMPSFWVAILLLLMVSDGLNWFPTSGYMDPALVNASVIRQSISVLHHMMLPLLTILIGGIAGLTQYNRASIIQVMNQPFILAAQARQISNWRILFYHAAKNALLPLITIMGLQLPSIISGSFVIEFIFAWPGLGQLGVQSIFSRDYPVLMATILFSSVLIIMGNILADALYRYADPRISS